MEQTLETNLEILRLLACPACKGSVERINEAKIVCKVCGNKYLIRNGIPDMVVQGFDHEDQFRIDSESAFFDDYGAKKDDYQVYEKSEYGRILDLMGLKVRTAEESILSIGCGSGVFEKELEERGYKVYGIDLAMKLLAGCLFPVARADCTKLPFPSGRFKNIFCAGVLHHVPTQLHTNVLQEIQRVLAPDGAFYAFEPKTTFRSRYLHPVSQLLRMRTKGEEPIPFERFKNIFEEVFSKIETQLVREVKFVDLNPFNRVIYVLVKSAFNIMPNTDKDEFFILIGRK